MSVGFLKAVPVWKAGENKIRNSVCAFYVSFKAQPNMELRIACCNVYKAYLNGKLLSIGPARAAHGYYRMDRIRLENVNEENLLFIEAAAYNTDNYCYVNMPGFLQAEVVSNDTPVAWTGEHFWVRTYTERLRVVSRYSLQRSFVESYDFSAPPTKEYADPVRGEYEKPQAVEGGAILDRTVSYTNYQPHDCVRIERGVFSLGVGDENRNIFTDTTELGIYPPEQWQTHACDLATRLEYTAQKIGEGLRAGEYALYDFSVVQTGYVRTTFRALADSVVYLLFDSLDLKKEGEHASNINFRRGNEFNLIEYRVKKGDFEHITIEPYVMRYLKIVVVAGEIVEEKMRILGCENPDTGRFSFVCQDEKLQKIIEAGVRTFKANALDILMDCPSRERAGWLCDAYFMGKVEQILTGNNKVEGAFLENYHLEPPCKKLPKGMVHMCYPSEVIGDKARYIPNWALWYIVELYDHYKRTGDKTQALQSKEKVYGIFGYFSEFLNKDGLIEDLDGWVFVEWSKANDPAFIVGVNYPTNMMYAKALCLAGELYGDEKLTLQAEHIRQKIVEQSFNGEFFEDNRIRQDGTLLPTGNISETCQYYAFFTGIATKEKYPALYKTLVKWFGAVRNQAEAYPRVYKSNAFIGNYLRLIMLLENGEEGRILSECKDFFYGMAKRTGTLWEHDGEYGSVNHGFASYAVFVMVNYMIGYYGRNGKKLLFKKCNATEDCQISIPIEDKEMTVIRKDGETSISIPDGYEIVEI